MNIMKILFLDVDGVLNMHSSGGLYALNRKRLKLLEQIVNETGCEIVVSSTWRKLPHTRKKLIFVLSYRGIKILDWTTTNYFKERQIRGDEIQLWLDNHTVSRYCIVDDDSDMLESQKPYFVKTDGNKGLTEETVGSIIKILGKKGM